jgi:aminoglycoside phosphotransferase (APT) family kinase protein
VSRGEALLGYLRGRLGGAVSYREEPRPLGGGFVTDVLTFSLDGAPDEWRRPLVLRVYTPDTDAAAVRREVCAQEVVAVQGVPAPRVLAWQDAAGVLDAPFMVMERLPGRPQMVIEFPALLAEVPRLPSLPRRHAAAMRMVHDLDAAPLIAAFAAAGIDRRDAGPEHWLDASEAMMTRWSLNGLRPGLDWLRANRPLDPARPSICHGDLFGANILEVRGKVTAIVDWNLVTVGDPAIDLGGQIAASEMSAVPGPRVMRYAVRGFGVALARGLRRAYAKYADLPEDRVRYYAAMRAFTELTFKLALLAEVQATGVQRRMATWDPPTCARYFRRHTGVALDG